MCLAIPGKITNIHEDNGMRMASTDFGGVIKRVCIEYTPDAQLGDYILVHVGFALHKIDEEEAARTFALLEELGQLDELESPQSDAELTPRPS